jgi:autotransporter-associated beta strand protein
MKMKPTFLSRLLLIPAACLAFATPVFADTGTWSATSGTWNTSNSNWTGVTGTPWDSSNGTLNIANFTSTSGNATVSGTVYANQITYTAASGSFLITSGAINLAGTTPTISVDPSRTLTIGSTLEGSAGLVKSGTGTLSLSGSNSYTGNTTISGGVLQISNANALGAGGAGNATTISTGGELALQGNITVSGETLDHNGGGSGFLRNVSGNNTWNGDITIGAGNSRIRSDAGLLTIGGNITMNSSPIFEGVGNTTVSGIVSGANILTIGGNNEGTVTLSGLNSYTGETVVSRGTLSVNTLKDFGTDSSVGKGNGTTYIQLGTGSTNGTLTYTGGATSSNRTFRVGSTIAGETGGGTIRNDGSGALVFTATTFNAPSGGVTANRTLTLGGTNADANTISGAIGNSVSGWIGLTKADAGTWILSGTNTYSGNTTISGGILQIGGAGKLGSGNYAGAISNNASFVHASSANQILGGVISGSGSLTKSGSATLTLSGNNSYTGNTTISGGTLEISNNNALGGTANGTTISTNGTLSLSGNITVASENLVHNGGSPGFLRNVSGNNAWNGNITISAGNSRINSDAGLLTLSGNLILNSSVIFQGLSNTTVSGNVSGASTLVIGANNQGTVTLSGNKTYTGETQVHRGTLSVDTLKDIGTSSSIGTGVGVNAVQLGSGNYTGTLLYTGGATSSNRTFRIGNPGIATDTSGGIIKNDGSGALVLSATTFNVAYANATVSRTLTLGGTNTGNNTISGAIVDNNATTGRIALVKADAGTWVLSGNNTYSGNTTISGGMLQISADSGLGTAPGAATAGHLNLNDATLGTTATMELNSNRGILLGGSQGGGIYVATGTTTYGGIIAGPSRGFQKDGAGTLVLSGSNSYTGGTLVSAGTLLVDGSLAAGNVSVSASATLGGNGTIGGAITVANNGILAPGTAGDATTTLTLNSTNLTISGTDSKINLDITGTASGEYDRIAGIATFAQGGDITFALTGSYVDGNSWNVFGFSGRSGTFSSVALTGDYTGSLSWDGTNWTNTNIGGQSWKFDETAGTLSVIPEPTTWALLAASLTTVMVLRRRRPRL